MENITFKTARFWSIVALEMVLAVGLLASQAWAETLRLTRTNVNAQSSPPLPNSTCLDLNSAAGNQNVATFSTPGPATLVFRFNAEAAVGGPVTNWLNVDIRLDPAGPALPFVVPPSSSDNAFVAGNGTPSNNDGWISALTQAVTTVSAGGVHSVQVCVNGMGAGATWRIDDLSLTVESQP